VRQLGYTQEEVRTREFIQLQDEESEAKKLKKK